MRILLVTPSYFPIVGGSEVLTRTLATKLNERGIKTDIATLNMDKKWRPKWKEETLKEGQVQIFKIGAFNPFLGLPNPLANFFRINVFPKPCFVKKFKDYDIIHFIGEVDLSFPIFSLILDRPKIMHCVGLFRHGGVYTYYKFKRPYLKSIFTKIFSNIANVYLAYSAEGKSILSDLDVPATKISVLQYTLDTNIFRPDSTGKIDNLVLFVGRLDRIKGLHILLQALNYLKVPIHLAIIGPRWDEEYMREIEQMISSINEKGIHKVELLGGMGQSELVSWYQRAAVVVCPYLYETYSIVALEALASGTPVVSTGTHIIEQSPDGISVSSQNPQDISKQIEKLITDKVMRENYGKQGRKIAEQYFSWESVIKNLIKKYEDVLKIHPQNP